MNLQIENTRKLYNVKYKYKVQLVLEGIDHIRYMKIDKATNFREQIEEKILKFKKYREKHGLGYAHYSTTVDERVYKLLDFLVLFTKSKYALRLYSGAINIYSNDLSFFEEMESAVNSELDVFEASLIPSEELTMYFKREPKFKYRTFFKSRLLKNPDSVKESILNFIDTHSEIAHVSEGLKRACNGVYFFRYFSGLNYFIEYNDASTQSFIHLWFGDLVGKTYSLKKET